MEDQRSRPVLRRNRLDAIAAFALGFAITANFSTAPSWENAPRILDLVTSGLAAVTFWYVLSSVFFLKMLLILFTAWYFLLYGIWGAFVDDASMTIASLRAAVSVLALPAAVQIIRAPRSIVQFLLGGAVGAALLTTIGIGQTLYPGTIFDAVIPKTAQTWWGNDGKIRAVGIFEHPNGLSQVALIGATMALTLIWFPRRALLGYVLFLGIVAANYYATSTRTGILSAAIAFIVVHGKHLSVKHRFLSIFIGSLFLVSALLLPHVLLGERWTGVTDSGMTIWDNLAERWSTTLTSFKALLSHPLGLGVSGRLHLLRDLQYGVSASHNSYLSFGLTFGLLASIMLVALVGSGLVYTRHQFLYPILIVIAVQMLAEDSIYSSSVFFSLILSRFACSRFLSFKPKEP